MPQSPNRQSLRLPGWDYAKPGIYFVTICVRDKKPLLEQIQGGEMILSPAGAMAREGLRDIPNRFETVHLHEYVLMPNHLHALCELHILQGDEELSHDFKCQVGVASPNIVGAFKSITTVRCIQGVHEAAWPAFKGRLWQRGHWDHVVRSDEDLNRIRIYIRQNPQHWNFDREIPAVVEQLPFYGMLEDSGKSGGWFRGGDHDPRPSGRGQAPPLQKK